MLGIKSTFFYVAFVLQRLYELGNRFQHWSKAHARKIHVVDNYSVDSRLDAFAGQSQGYDCHLLHVKFCPDKGL